MMIRKAQMTDIDEIMAVETLSFVDPWSRASFAAEIEDEGRHYLVAVEKGRVIGYGGFWSIVDEGHITNIAVHPDFRGEGVGKALVAELLETGRALKLEHFTLEVRASNTAAIALYEKLGFESAGERPGYYSKPREAALIMWKDMK